MLCSRIVASRIPSFERRRKKVIEITATGIDALTVSPTFKTRYSDEAPNTIPNNVPTMSGSTDNSLRCASAGMNGRNATAGSDDIRASFGKVVFGINVFYGSFKYSEPRYSIRQVQ